MADAENYISFGLWPGGSSEYLYKTLKFKADNDCQASIQGGFSRRVAGFGAAGRMKVLATDMFAELTEY